MKKISHILTALILISCIGVIFSACNQEGGKSEHAQITAAYAERYDIDRPNVSFTCYGEFGGAHVLMYESAYYPDALSAETVDGVIFHHSQIKQFDVYHEGSFYSLQAAFENGLLTHDDLLAVRERYNPAWVEGAGTEYRLTVSDPNGYIIEPMQEKYQAGERVTVKTEVLFDVDLVAYLDGVSLGIQTAILENDEYHWEFYFEMPAHDAVLSFGLSGGFLKASPDGLDERAEREIIAAFVAAHQEDRYPISEEEVSLRCYGVYGGAYVLFVDVAGWGYNTSIETEVIAGIEFVYSSGQTLSVYCGGSFYSLQGAYENKILTHDDLLATQKIYRERHAYLY